MSHRLKHGWSIDGWSSDCRDVWRWRRWWRRRRRRLRRRRRRRQNVSRRCAKLGFVEHAFCKEHGHTLQPGNVDGSMSCSWRHSRCGRVRLSIRVADTKTLIVDGGAIALVACCCCSALRRSLRSTPCLPCRGPLLLELDVADLLTLVGVVLPSFARARVRLRLLLCLCALMPLFQCRWQSLAGAAPSRFSERRHALGPLRTRRLPLSRRNEPSDYLCNRP